MNLDAACDTVEAGGLVVFPTETVWGIGARYDDPAACARIFIVKERDPSMPLQVLVASGADIDRFAERVPGFDALAARFMPGPLTVVLPATRKLGHLGETRGTVGVRVPDHPVALALLARTGPLAASSANRSGEPTPDTLAEIRRVFGDEVDAYLDGEPSPGRTGSTVVDLTSPEPVVLRAGAVSADDLSEVLDRPVRESA